MGRHVYLAAIVLLAHFSSRGGETYFGGHGDTNSHWVGYELKVSRGAMKWKAYTLAAEQRGKIKEAGATFFQEGTNSWSGIFEEIEVGSTGSNVVYDVTYGLSHHTLHVVKSDQREFIDIMDGKDVLKLRRVSKADAREIKLGRVPRSVSSTLKTESAKR